MCPAQHQEQVGIFAEGLVVTVAAFHKVTILVDYGMPRHDRRAGGVLLEQTIHPCQQRLIILAAVFDVDADEFHPASLEQEVVVVVIETEVTAVVGPAHKAVNAEVLVDEGIAGYIRIYAEQYSSRSWLPRRYRKGSGGRRFPGHPWRNCRLSIPDLKPVRVLHQVTHMRRVVDGSLVVNDPLRL